MAKILTLVVLLTSHSGLAANMAPGLLCNNEFVFISTWVGNIYGVFDALGWTVDWIAGYVYYKKDDSPEVDILKNRIKTLKEADHKKHKQRMKEIANICDHIIAHIKNEDGQDRDEARRELLELTDCAEAILNVELDRPLSLEIIG